jgi:hypothetical protein
MKNWAELQRSITPMIAGEGERIPWTWYHRQAYVDNTTTQLTFFNATGVLTTTNMQAAGQIPAPMFYDVYHIGIWIDQIAFATQYVDVQGLLDSIVTLQVAQKVYFQAPAWMLPPGGGVDGQTAIATDSTARNGVADLRNRYAFWGDITIPHNQNFSVVMDWAAAVNIAANVDIVCALDGYLYRRVL